MHAEWRKLLMVNYRVDPDVLLPFVPAHTELAVYDNTCWLSLVGFRFIKVRMAGIAIPFHTNFSEVNLRFYVRQKCVNRHSSSQEDVWRYGVVFIKEIVALPVVSFVANQFYKEPYETHPLKHVIHEKENEIFTQYQWKKHGFWNNISIHSELNSFLIQEKTLPYFLTAQYWGFTSAGKTKTFVYAVHHPPWKMYKTLRHSVQIDYKTAFGERFSFLDRQGPDLVFLTEGSPITLHKKAIIVP